MTPQSGILPPANGHALFTLFRRRLGRRADARLKALLASVSDRIIHLQGEDPQASGVIAFGPHVWPELYSSKPALLRDFPSISGAIHPAPASEVDVLLHLRGERYDLLHEFADQLSAEMSEWLDVIETVHGFRYRDARDLTGFVDGTENPVGDERAEVALLADGDWAGGSYIHLQRYVHRMEQWKKLPVRQQEAVIGRTKDTNEELPDEDRPHTAHISRVIIEEDGEELAMLRHSMPYGSPGGDKGLYFISYCKTPVVFEKMLTRMVAPTSDGRVDHMLNFTRAVTGAAFFAPSIEQLKQLQK
ncbi:Dyp-type peroxidase [Iodobacter fluviatilis]|uniref:Iron-dependent peroxidase n=1 Tax=Iodobacter fluviatilis TaxID=537 RepID=A0A377SUG7_9NEIS|nr:Dyp-type peroxidase [Iodobacter fluviatilis]TCU86232.1 putative iron-dependent peroxidase [Iodobacter fluviatilis]STR44643.1 Probable deferrochelatase/peroxidase YfeX [Iodobacter fluviatilis]